MFEKIKRKKQVGKQDITKPKTIDDLIRKYDLENIDIYNFLDELIDSLNNETKSVKSTHFIEARPSTATTLTTTASKIPLGTIQEENDPTGILSLSDGGILCGRDGKVMVSASAYFSGLTAEDNVAIYIYKNNSLNGQFLQKLNRTSYYMNIAPKYLTVSAGDIIYLYAINGTGDRGTCNTNIQTRLTVQYVA